MQVYKKLSEETISNKVESINSIEKRELDEEYLAMKNEMNNISTIKNSFIIVLFTGLIAFWVCVLTSKESIVPNVPYVLLLPQFFIYIIQDKLLTLADLHIRIQAQIWTTYKSCYEHNYILISKMLYGPRKQTVISRIRKIPAFYMGIANGLIVLVMSMYVYMNANKSNMFIHWLLTLIIVFIIQVAITIKFWDSRNGEYNLISYAEEIINNPNVVRGFKETKDVIKKAEDNSLQEKTQDKPIENHNENIESVAVDDQTRNE